MDLTLKKCDSYSHIISVEHISVLANQIQFLYFSVDYSHQQTAGLMNRQ